MENKELIIEFLSEEIPARFQVNACAQFEQIFKDELDSLGFEYRDIKVIATPRRMALTGNVCEFSKAKTTEKKGPLVDATAVAITGFLNSVGLSLEQCKKRDINGKIYLFAVQKSEPKQFAECLPGIVNKILEKFKWNKSMHWGSLQFMWARPLRNVLCVFGGQTVSFAVKCLNLMSSSETVGHRFLGTTNKFAVHSISEYIGKLRENFVILDREERIKIILDGIQKIEQEKNIKVDIHEGLLQEVAGLVEYPVVYAGRIPDEFMSIPAEILEVSMRVNQRYFCAKNSNGDFSEHFVFVANIPGTDGGKTIIEGNQKVLCARLADAKFFFENDKKKSLENLLPELKKLSFQDGLGTMADKSDRLAKIAERLGYLSSNVESLKRAAILSKCDLKTEVVCEFPEVQGIMGGHYAKNNGENSYVYKAIYEQYFPLGDRMPLTEGGSLLSICDKLDSLVGFFSIGKAPTGSKDPFALRRAAIGILKIIEANNFNLLDLQDVLNYVFEMFKTSFPKTKFDEDAPKAVYQFILARLKVLFKENGIIPEMLSVFSAEHNILNMINFSKQLTDYIASENGNLLFQMYKRAFCISDAESISDSDINIDVTLFNSDEERNLYSILTDANLLLEKAKNLAEKLDILSKISNTVSKFFDDVLINDSNESIKQNRIRLVKYVLKTCNSIGNLSVLIK